MTNKVSVVMLGATGAVGNHTAKALASHRQVKQLLLLGRRPVDNIKSTSVVQQHIDITNPQSYEAILIGYQVAICTLGVGQPSKVSKAEFTRVDHDAALAFATACKRAGVCHFQLLSSVAVDPNSKSFYLRSKGQLESSIKALGFERLSLFHPSMIVTPKNRYGKKQALALALSRIISPLLLGQLRRFRGVKVEYLGKAIAINVFQKGELEETLHWDEFMALVKSS